MAPDRRLVLRGGIEAALLVLYGAPQYILPVNAVQDVELFRLACATLVTAVAVAMSWNAGVVAFLHCALHSYTTLCMDDTTPSFVTTTVFVFRVFSFERLLSIALFPRMSYEARLRENKVKLEKFFRMHDPSRVAEAEALLLEFVGNESLLFVQLRQKYAPSTAQKKSVSSSHHSTAFSCSSPVITHDTTVGRVVLEATTSRLQR